MLNAFCDVICCDFLLHELIQGKMQGPKAELEIGDGSTLLFDGKGAIGRGVRSEVYPCKLKKTEGDVIDRAVVKCGVACSRDEHDINEAQLKIWKKIPTHENVVELYTGVVKDLDKHDHGFNVLMVTEQMDSDLSHLIYYDKEFSRKCTYEDMVEILEQICQGLHHFHENGVLHHDLKPGKVLISERDGKWVAKLSGFGCSKSFKGGQTSVTASIRGTLDYMAPEVTAAPFFRQSSVRLTKAVDIFSFGVMMWELLNRRKPNEKFNSDGKIGKNISWPTATMKFDVWCQAPEPLCDIIQSCLAFTKLQDTATSYKRPTTKDLLQKFSKIKGCNWMNDRVAAYSEVRTHYRSVCSLNMLLN